MVVSVPVSSDLPVLYFGFLSVVRSSTQVMETSVSQANVVGVPLVSFINSMLVLAASFSSLDDDRVANNISVHDIVKEHFVSSDSVLGVVFNVAMLFVVASMVGVLAYQRSMVAIRLVISVEGTNLVITLVVYVPLDVYFASS